MSMSMFEMDRKIRELEDAMTANDEYLHRVEALNEELLTALKALLETRCAEPEARAAIAKAEAFKP
jgi:hypothetical protein